MNADAIRALPRYLDGGDGSLWRVSPAEPLPENMVFVRLSDVLAILEKEKSDGK